MGSPCIPFPSPHAWHQFLISGRAPQDSEEADKVKVVVSREEAIASAEAAKVKAIKVRRQALADA